MARRLPVPSSTRVGTEAHLPRIIVWADIHHDIVVSFFLRHALTFMRRGNTLGARPRGVPQSVGFVPVDFSPLVGGHVCVHWMGWLVPSVDGRVPIVSSLINARGGVSPTTIPSIRGLDSHFVPMGTMNATRCSSGHGRNSSTHPSGNIRANWMTKPRCSPRNKADTRTNANANENQVIAASTATEAKESIERPKDAVELDAKYVLQTYARAPPVFVKGKGCVLEDQQGKEYLDFASGIAVNALGHADEEWLRTVQEQAATLTHVSNLYYTVPQAELARVLVESSFGDRVFYCNSGTEANEAAIKFARKCARKRAGVEDQAEFIHPPKKSWWSWGNGSEAYTDAKGQPAPPTEIVAFSDGFHGRTMGALALTWKKQYRTPFEPVMPGAVFATYNDLESAREVIRKGKTAAVFVEPVQGEGGCKPADPHFLKGIRELCDQAGALLVFDEVQCGLGRTGSLWAHEPFGVSPDIMTLAKPLAGGLPIGAVLMTEEVAQAMAPGDHGTTFAGGPLICSAALTVMKRVQAPGFLEDVRKKGELLQALLRDAIGDHPAVEGVRGSGLLVGVQMTKMVGPLVNAAREKGLLVISAGKGDVLRIVPPLVVTEEEIKRCVAVLKDCMDAI